MTTDSILELDSLSKAFGGVQAVDQLSMSVPRGTVFGLMGPNGAGKTSAINLITGFFKADSGTINFLGETITASKSHQVARLGISRTYQNVRLFSGMTAVEQVIAGTYLTRHSRGWQSVGFLPSERRDRRAAEATARELLNRVGFDRHDEMAQNLSYGDQRRVEIARALASDPSLLLLDEPTAGMNSEEAAAIGGLLRSLRDDGLTMLVVEHNMALILDHCDLAMVMNFGRGLISGTPRQCVDDEAVQEAYFGRKSDAERVSALRQLRGH